MTQVTIHLNHLMEEGYFKEAIDKSLVKEEVSCTPWAMWGDSLSLCSQFYEVIILESTYATGERKKNASVLLVVKLHL